LLVVEGLWFNLKPPDLALGNEMIYIEIIGWIFDGFNEGYNI